jgi:regulator of sigma E protease
MDILIKAVQLIMSLSILVVLHELGHFIPARLFKIRVEKFYLFFNPWFSLVKKKFGETEWGIGWLPLGGYVKIAGMVDESMDKEQLSKPAEPWEFRSKPAWQRLIVMCGGVIVNMLLGILIYILIVFAWGETRIAPTDLEAGLSAHPIVQEYGFRPGDVVLAIEGEKVLQADEVNKEIMLRGARNFEVQHADGSKENLQLPEDIDYALFKAGAMKPFDFRIKSNMVDSILPEGQSNVIGVLQNGDVMLSIADTKITYWDEIVGTLYKNKNKKVALSFVRGTDTLLREVQVTEKGTIGFSTKFEKYMLDTAKIQDVQYSLMESISVGTSYGFTTLGDYVGQLKYIFTEKGASSIGGFGAIGNLFPATWDWQRFWENTALISIILAFMNILPIPALDGGHVMFLIYEMVTGKEAPQKVLEVAQYIGIVLLLTLMVYANGNDLYKAIFGG